jgi:hypothetical protein
VGQCGAIEGGLRNQQRRAAGTGRGDVRAWVCMDIADTPASGVDRWTTIIPSAVKHTRSAVCLLLLGFAAAVAAADPLPTVAISGVRDAVEGHRIRCFAVFADSVPDAAITVTLAYGGTATTTSDFTAPLTVTLPSGMPTDKAIFVPVDAVVDADSTDETIICTIQDSAAYEISSTEGSATVALLPAFADNQVCAAGEPDTVVVAANDLWVYDLHISHPRQLPEIIPELPVQPFIVEVAAIAGGTLPDFPITIERQEVDGVASFVVTAEPATEDGGKQFRFRLRIKADVDGDQEFVTPGGPTTTGGTSEDIYTEQDIVLVVTLAGDA